MRDEFIDLVDSDTGDEVRYRRYAARVPDFLAKYPPKDGYSVECTTTDLLSLQPGLLSLLKEALAAGRKLTDLGLPALDRALSTFVCTARLCDVQGRKLRSASACASVLKPKDYERLETAADQRLLARLGFGGEMFNQEEDEDFVEQGLSIATGDATSPAPTLPSESQQQSSPSDTASVEDGAAEHDKGAEALRVQVRNLAKRLGQAVPEMKSRKDAENALRELGEVQRRSRTAAAA